MYTYIYFGFISHKLHIIAYIIRREQKQNVLTMGKDKSATKTTTSSDKMDESGDGDTNKKSPSSSKKSSSSSSSNNNKIEITYEERCLAVNAISYPLASKKSTKKIHKLVRKACSKKLIRRGVKETIKGIRKNEVGLVILAGDIYPIDVISHIPIVLEEKNIPYLFVPSKLDLGSAALTKRATSCILIKSPLSSATNGATPSKKKKSKKDTDDNDATNTGDDDDEIKELYDTLLKEAQAYDPMTAIIKKKH